MAKNILVISAHADDEALGCGGTIAKHIAHGDSVHVVFLTNGVGSRAVHDFGATDAIARSTASMNALNVLGVHETHLTAFSFPDNSIDSVPRLEVVKALESVISKVQPAVVYTHHAGDLNIDHRYAYEATMTACRPQPGVCVREIYSYEVPSSTAWSGVSFGRYFVPTLYVDVAAYWEHKERALIAYEDEMREFPHARSSEALRSLSMFRGSQVGMQTAEAFVVERQLWS